MYFSNSNLCSFEEYEKRLAAARTVAEHFGVELICDEYDHESWLDAVRGYESEPERGERCRRCFAYSLGRTAVRAAETGENFATTLTVSPHKDSGVIFDVCSGYSFFESLDFKKRDGFLLSMRKSLELKIYRQNFCGCEFSRRVVKSD